MMSRVPLQITRSLAFTFWSLRRRGGQALPVTLAFLLLLAALQSLSALHDVSSQLVRAQIARNWRGSYDLLVRPATAVSQLELASGWINPQSLLETYGGITQEQMASVRALPHVVAVTPLATAGWQTVMAQVPLTLPPQAGIYRVSLGWKALQQSSTVVTDYLEVTDLAHLTTEPALPDLLLHTVLLNAHPLYKVTLPALQIVIGGTPSSASELAAQMQTGLNPPPSAQFTLHLEQLQAPRAQLPQCLKILSCWRDVAQTETGPLTFQPNGNQLWRFSHAQYSATSGQLAEGTISLIPSGADLQGALYRQPQPINGTLPANLVSGDNLSTASILPFTLAQHLPLLPASLRFIPLDEACALNGPSCYSGLYVRLSGVEQYSQQSLALLQATAAAIMAHTGLHVDILDGSSLRQVHIQLPTSTQPLASTWRATGVAVQIVHNEDALHNLLLILACAVCLLALCSAGILVGVGRRKEALLLAQIGWHRPLLVLRFLLDALLLASPGLLLFSGGLLLFTRAGLGIFSPQLTWMLLATGLLIYSTALVLTACRPLWSEQRSRQAGHTGKRRNPLRPRLRNLPWQSTRLRRFSAAARAGSLISLIAYLALIAAVFLCVLALLLLVTLQQALAVTVLGGQVATVLAWPHLALFGVILGAALLTLLLSTHLRFSARRDEFSLLANLGWEGRHVFRRLLSEAGWPGLICGVLGTCLALALLLPKAVFSLWLALGALFLVGPLCGMVLAGMVTGILAWRVSRSVDEWK